MCKFRQLDGTGARWGALTFEQEGGREGEPAMFAHARAADTRNAAGERSSLLPLRGKGCVSKVQNSRNLLFEVSFGKG